MDERDAITKWCQSLRGRSERLGVAIEPDDLESGMRGQQSLAVASATDRGVNEHAGGHRFKERNNFVAQDRNVFERMDHLQPPDWLEERRVSSRSTCRVRATWPKSD